MKKEIAIIGFPMDLGASRRGVDMGPFALRVAQIKAKLKQLNYIVHDIGNIDIPFPENLKAPPNPSAKFLTEIAEANRRLADVVYENLQKSRIPLVLGGDHSLAIGSVAGTSRYFQEQEKKIGLLWLDAHADINTPQTSPTGNIHGMPVAHILGLGEKQLSQLSGKAPMVDPESCVIIGLRDVDEGEKQTLCDLGVHVFTMQHIDEMGLAKVMDEALTIVQAKTSGFHLSFDVDWIDPQGAPGVGTPAPGGATYREGHLAMEKAFDTGKIIAIDIAEVNPIMDHGNQTAIMAVEMVVSAFGKKIL
ncbi:MAG: arginase [Bdellovibrionales bacterium]|nr:arginase [Bdellovibrionales bacterium]